MDNRLIVDGNEERVEELLKAIASIKRLQDATKHSLNQYLLLGAKDAASETALLLLDSSMQSSSLILDFMLATLPANPIPPPLPKYSRFD